MNTNTNTNPQPKIPDWHSPIGNPDCAQNHDIHADCTCKRVVNRKPYRVCRVIDPHAPHGVKPEIVLEVHPNGMLAFRQKGSPKRYTISSGEIYAALVWKQAKQKAQARRESRKLVRRRK